MGFNIIGMLSTAVCIFVDYWFISAAMGTDGLTALSLGVPVYSIIFGLGLMLGVGGGAKYAELRAAGKNDEANKYFTVTIKIGCIVSAVIAAIGGLFAVQAAELLGAREHILPMTSSYIRVLFLLAPGAILYCVFESFARNDRAPRTAMISSIIYNIMNIILDYIFIFIFGWGMFGAALATTSGSICALLFLLIYCHRKKVGFRFVKTRTRMKRLLPIFVIGAQPTRVMRAI